MNTRSCEWIRDLLPDLGTQALEAEEARAVEEHLRSCHECRKEQELLGLLRGAMETGVRVPDHLAERIQARLRVELQEVGSGATSRQDPVDREVGQRNRGKVLPLFGRGFGVPAWALSAAAVVILALGAAVIWNNRTPEVVEDPVVVAVQDPLPEAWLMDDGLVAGGVVFDGLSDEELEALLQEYEG